MNDWARKNEYGTDAGNGELCVRKYRRPRLSIIRKLEMGIATEDEIRAYYWLRNELLSKRAQHLSSKNIFGVIGFEVPLRACDPALVERIMAEQGIVLLEKTPWCDARTGRIISVSLTYDTPEIGMINMPV